MSNTTEGQFVYYKSYSVQYRVKLIGEPIYVEGSFTRFGLTIKSLSAMLRFEYASGAQGVASVSCFQETPWADLPIAYDSFNADGSNTYNK